ncbi:hypothetical protein BDV38DRAFT_293564 [Aspergillus pseudotamarii]|uniref:Bacteriophage T5 Orf172 DNA-binding domain-containing protein n=1 Tax=Aspergillus pseudotamarii TaxID=132259 RepID=A0A5N6ST89_ASPPS|nr:uncharacterized protein BDV38DRAFT_293564 [Aspergillus pseudotamarii]KAE8137001.1 hypothetical protein BDV38DRAFT_293564 [Aspergillus pseudotamarii]
MPAKEISLIPFHLLLPSHPEHIQCAAYTGDGPRCSTMAQNSRVQNSKVRSLKLHNIHRINELHAELQKSYATKIDDEARENLLKELADLTICGRQKSKIKGVIETAVHQWNAELQSQDSATVSLETPPRNINTQSKDDKGSSKLEFTLYQTAEVDKLVRGELIQELDRIIDRRISQKFIAHNLKDQRDYLYIFQCEEAEGMCKLGRTGNLSRRASEHEKCYPNLTQRRSLYCPNSELFEKVVQLELTQYRYKHECPKCNATHTEWFKADIDDICQRVEVWCLFSKGFQSIAKRSQVSIPYPGFSSDPDRWYKWAQKYVQSWDKEMLHPEPNTSGKSVVDNDTVTGDDDAESMPGLSPSSSASGAPDDDYSNPPTPTPIERSRNVKSTWGQRLIIPPASPSVSPEIYWSAVESMPIPKDRVLFPRVPGEFPESPVKVAPKEITEDENELVDSLGNVKLF